MQRPAHFWAGSCMSKINIIWFLSENWVIGLTVVGKDWSGALRRHQSRAAQRSSPPSAWSSRPFRYLWQQQVCFVVICLAFAFRFMICKEIIRDKLHPLPQLFRGFHMEIYCFPDPSDPHQVMLAFQFSPSFQEVLITSYGATENELQAVFIRMHDWERLLLARRTISQLELLGKRGTFSVFLSLSRLYSWEGSWQSSRPYLRWEGQGNCQAFVSFNSV